MKVVWGVFLFFAGQAAFASCELPLASEIYLGRVRIVATQAAACRCGYGVQHRPPVASGRNGILSSKYCEVSFQLLKPEGFRGNEFQHAILSGMLCKLKVGDSARIKMQPACHDVSESKEKTCGEYSDVDDCVKASLKMNSFTMVLLPD